MIAPVAAALSLLAAQPAAPPIQDAFLAAVAAGDGAGAQGLLAEDATIMHEESGRPEPATAAAIAAFLRGCRSEIRFQDADAESGTMAYNAHWSCGPRGGADMLLWTREGRVVWVQLMKLEPEAAAQGDR